MNLYKGESIRSANTMLAPIDIEELKRTICCPDEKLENDIARLRIIRNLDKQQYASAKRDLPFIVCAAFNPAYRRLENFAYTEHFILDIDNLSEKGLDPEDVKKSICTDNRVMMAFVSPGNDGLKVLFGLSEKCYDAGEYSLFYKAFASSFSRQHNLDQVTDSRTSDATRACFLSVDKNVFYRPEAELVVLKDYVDIDDPFDAFSLKRALEKNEVDNNCDYPDLESVNSVSDEALEKIKTVLASKREKQRIEKRDVYVPKEVELVMQALADMLASNGIAVSGLTDIQYGKKIQLCLDENRNAEINLFYGRRGFTVVSTPKRGTDAEFSELAADLIDCSIDEIYESCRER